MQLHQYNDQILSRNDLTDVHKEVFVFLIHCLLKLSFRYRVSGEKKLLEIFNLNANSKIEMNVEKHYTCTTLSPLFFNASITTCPTEVSLGYNVLTDGPFHILFFEL